ncbi:transposase [Streptomyces caelestis]|uniref:transposase n=1 Tax=Streptomyces caelestis TaxID=36816 RepID=UPI00365054EE
MGRRQAGDRDILIVFDAGYDAPRMACLLEGLPVEVLGRTRTDRVMRKPVLVPRKGARPSGETSTTTTPSAQGEERAAVTGVPRSRAHPSSTPRTAASTVSPSVTGPRSPSMTAEPSPGMTTVKRAVGPDASPETG